MTTVAASPSPNEVAQTLIGRDYISFTALSTYQQCPLKFYFKYVERLPEPSVAASLVFGGAIHTAVEHHFRERMIGHPPPDLAELLDVYELAWRERDGEGIEILFGKDASEKTLAALAGRMLAAFQASDFAKPNGTLLAIEEELRGPLVAGLPDLVARIDLLMETDDAVVLTDLKTSRSRWSLDHVTDSSGQLLLYSKLARELVPHKRLVTQFAVLTKAKSPALDLHPVPVDVPRVENSLRLAGLIWQAICAGHFYPIPSFLNCPTCPYRDVCRPYAF
jgi:CRISPR/Cas system-associated exonuclease Cas4 (RecB family)